MYSRQNPSPFYIPLIEQYIKMHSEGYLAITGNNALKITGEQTFPGKSILPFKDHIKDLVVRFGCQSLLDYGCGKGEQYTAPYVENPENPLQKMSMSEFLGLSMEQVHLYEPALTDTGQTIAEADIVISTDVLEHCHMADMPWIVEEMFQKARKCLFINISGTLAKAHLPCGENAHISVRPGIWWAGFFQAIGAKYPHLHYVVSVDEFTPEGTHFRVFSSQPVYTQTPERFTYNIAENTTAEEVKPIKVASSAQVFRFN